MEPKWVDVWVGEDLQRVLVIPDQDEYIRQLEEVCHS